jgi:hypothetical protein
MEAHRKDSTSTRVDREHFAEEVTSKNTKDERELVMIF